MTNCCDTCPDLGNKDCTKLTDYNNSMVRPLSETASYVDPCDLHAYLGKYINRQGCLNEGIINNICNIWK